MTKTERHKQAVKPIPPFESIEQEAEFWDSHSVVDQIDEGTLVGFHRPRSKTLKWYGSVTPKQRPEDFRSIRDEFEEAVAREVDRIEPTEGLDP